MSTTQTINAILDAIETTLAANDALKALLGNSGSSIHQYTSNQERLLRAMMANPQASSPALWINYDREDWINNGLIHVRKVRLYIDVVIFDPTGLAARQNSAYPIIDKVYDVLNDSQLGLTSPLIDLLQPMSDRYMFDVADETGTPLEISTWRVEFQTSVEWQA